MSETLDPLQAIPVFPSAILPANRNAFAWDSYGNAAYATGSTINFCTTATGKLERLYSVDFRPGSITALAFHSIGRRLCFGDNNGRVIFWEMDLRAAFASAVPMYFGETVHDLAWSGNIAIALFSNKKLVAFTHSPGVKTETLFDMKVLWELPLIADYTRLSLSDNQILLSGNHAEFSIYRSNKMQELPTAVFESVELSQNDEIYDAQWSIHFPNFIFVVTHTDINLFHIDSQCLVPLIRQRKSGSSFMKLIQYSNDHTTLTSLHRNGSLTFFKADKYMKFNVFKEILPKQMISSIVSVAKSPLYDDRFLALVDSLGPAIFDVNSYRFTETCFSFPLTPTSIDCHAPEYAIGTKSGHVIYGTFDGKKIKRFLVLSSPITYVGLSKDRIFFLGGGQVGHIDLASSTVIRYQSRGSDAIKCTHSYGGAFLVQRDPTVLSVYLDNREIPIIFDDSLLDFSLDRPNSNSSNGRFAALLRSKQVHFMQYSSETGVTLRSKFSVNSSNEHPLVFSWNNNDIVTGFQGGFLLAHNFQSKKTVSLSSGCHHFQHVEFCGSNTMFGKGNDLFKYEISSQSYHPCPLPVFDYALFDENTVMVLGQDSIVRLLRVSDWRQLSTISTSMRPPDLTQTTACFVRNRPQKWMRPEAKPFYALLENSEIPISVNYKTGEGEIKFENVLRELYNKVPIVSGNFLTEKWHNSLFTDRFEEAAQTLMNEDENFIQNATLASCIVATEETPISEKLIVQMKSVAASLFMKEEFVQGSIFLRMARQDKDAFKYLLENEQVALSMRFLRSALVGDDKKWAQERLALKLMERGDKLNAALLFAANGNYHMAIYLLNDIGFAIDAFMLKKEAKEKGMLVDNPKGDAPSLEMVSTLIDSAFVEFAEKAGIKSDEVTRLLM